MKGSYRELIKWTLNSWARNLSRIFFRSSALRVRDQCRWNIQCRQKIAWTQFFVGKCVYSIQRKIEQLWKILLKFSYFSNSIVNDFLSVYIWFFLQFPSFTSIELVFVTWFCLSAHFAHYIIYCLMYASSLEIFKLKKKQFENKQQNTK